MINGDQPHDRHVRAIAGPATLCRPLVFDSSALHQRVSAQLTKWLNPYTIGAALVLVAVAFYSGSGTLQGDISAASAVLRTGSGDEIGHYLRSFGVWGPIISLVLMVLQAVVAPIPGSLVSMANGLAYGVFWGGLLTLIGQVCAAIACFAIARHLGRSRVESLVGGNGALNSSWLVRWGAIGIIVTRLIPGLSFDVISYAAGLTRMAFSRFLIATAIGAAPQAFFASYLMQASPMLAWLFVGFSAAVMGGIALYTYARRRSKVPAVVVAED